MPEFQMITEGFAETLSSLERGYIEAMFFTSQVPGSVVMDFSGDGVESRYMCTLPRDEPQFIKADWLHPDIQTAIREGTSDGTIPTDAGIADINPETLADIRKDLADLFDRHRALFDAAAARDGYDMEQAGRDVWFTQGGHGVGFWDRAALDEGDLGDRLSEAVGRCDVSAEYIDAQTGIVIE